MTLLKRPNGNLTTDDSMSHELGHGKGAGGVISVQHWTCFILLHLNFLILLFPPPRLITSAVPHQFRDTAYFPPQMQNPGGTVAKAESRYEYP